MSQSNFYTINSGKLVLKTLQTKIHELATSSYLLGIRQTTMNYEVNIKMYFVPKDREIIDKTVYKLSIVKENRVLY